MVFPESGVTGPLRTSIYPEHHDIIRNIMAVKCTMRYIYTEENGNLRPIPLREPVFDFRLMEVPGMLGEKCLCPDRRREKFRAGRAPYRSLIREMEAWGITLSPASRHIIARAGGCVRKNSNMRYIVVRHEEMQRWQHPRTQAHGRSPHASPLRVTGATNLTRALYAKEEGLVLHSKASREPYTGRKAYRDSPGPFFRRSPCITIPYMIAASDLLLNLRVEIRPSGTALHRSLSERHPKQRLDTAHTKREICISRPHIVLMSNCSGAKRSTLQNTRHHSGMGLMVRGIDIALLKRSGPHPHQLPGKGIIPEDHPWESACRISRIRRHGPLSMMRT